MISQNRNERTEAYYKKRPCAEMVKSAAEIIDEIMGITQTVEKCRKCYKKSLPW